MALWWLYFDVVAPVAERELSGKEGTERVRLARDSYTYLHFPMIAGIIYLALGLKKVAEYVADTEHHALTDLLKGTGSLGAVRRRGGVPDRPPGVPLAQRRLHHPPRAVVAVLVLVAPLAVAGYLRRGGAGRAGLILGALIAFEVVRYAEARRPSARRRANSPTVSRVDLPAAFLGPQRVEGTVAVHPLVGVRAEEVPQPLDQRGDDRSARSPS